MKNREKEKGAIIIETTLVLTMFMFAIVTIIMVIDVVLAQAKIGVAIDATAKEISEYSYLYGLTGLNDIKKDLNDQTIDTKEKVDSTMEGINNIFNAIENMGETGRSTNITDPKSVSSAWDSIVGESGQITSSASTIKNVADQIKDDPKSFIFGIAKIALADGIDYATSKFIAEPISKAMVQKHLKNYDGQDTEQFLAALRIVPGNDGTYLSGLDFSESSLFMYGSDDIRIVVKYKIKVVPLLPIKTTYTLRQTAITKGWLGGDCVESKSEEEAMNDYIKKELAENDSLWTTTTIPERSKAIRDDILDEMTGYGVIQEGYQNVDAYSPTDNTFLMVASTNPLYGTDTEHPKTPADVTDEELKEFFDRNCNKMNAELDGINQVAYKIDGQKQKSDVPSPFKKTFVVIIPEDKDLDVRVNQFLSSYDSGGIDIVIERRYGNGAAATEVNSETDGG